MNFLHGRTNKNWIELKACERKAWKLAAIEASLYTLLLNAKVVGLNPTRVIRLWFVHKTRESTEYTVLTHIGCKGKTKINKVMEGYDGSPAIFNVSGI